MSCYKISKYLSIFAKMMKFRQIWSHSVCATLLLVLPPAVHSFVRFVQKVLNYIFVWSSFSLSVIKQPLFASSFFDVEKEMQFLTFFPFSLSLPLSLSLCVLKFNQFFGKVKWQVLCRTEKPLSPKHTRFVATNSFDTSLGVFFF